MLHTELPSFAEAISHGDIGVAHLRPLARVMTAERLDIARRDEHVLLKAATTLDPTGFARALRYWQQLCDDELHDPTTVDQIEAKRKVRLAALADGMWRLEGDLDPLTGEALATALEQTMGKPSADDDRSIGQRRHDALGDIARALLANDELGTVHGDTAAVTVIVQANNGLSATVAGMVLPPFERDLAMCDGPVTSVWIDATGKPFDVGTSVSPIPLRNRKAVIARDRHCRFPGCDRPARWTDVHHVNGRKNGHHSNELVLLPPAPSNGPSSTDRDANRSRRCHRRVHSYRRD